VLKVASPELSLVIPVYNGAGFLAASLDRLSAFVDTLDAPPEIIVVDDGSSDATPELLSAAEAPALTTIRHPSNRGKFAALKTGMAAARGSCRVFTDADLPYDLEALPYMAKLVTDDGFHLIVGDRTLAESEHHTPRPPMRGLSSQLFSFSVRMLVTGELFDTQVGLKGFRGDVAEALFPLVTDDGFAGDVELLYIALKHNLAIRRIPVRLLRAGTTTVRVASHALPMLGRIAGLRRRWSTGGYDSAALRTIAEQRYWDDGR
jgi:glycosyltransferase involved in cell wall biosynthesis